MAINEAIKVEPRDAKSDVRSNEVSPTSERRFENILQSSLGRETFFALFKAQPKETRDLLDDSLTC